MSNPVKTTCPYCGVGCGILATPHVDGSVTIQGDPDHPANFGRLCSKGTALGETLSMEGRLLTPEIGGHSVDWETAIDTVAHCLSSTIEEHGPDAVALYVSGQLLTEDYYVANKLMKGFIGSANIDTNSRLCMSSAVAAHKRAFGSDTVACQYRDIDHADLITLVGSNTAWCHPVLYQRIVKAKTENPSLQVVVIDPRTTATTEIADLHLPVSPGSDGYLFSGLLSHLSQQGKEDHEFLHHHCEGQEETLQKASETCGSIDQVAQLCGIHPDQLTTFYNLFSQTEKCLTLFSQGINQSTSGTDKGNAIINCHLLTGRIGKPGMGPFSITGQPNAMGGREVGGLSNQLAAHMEIENPEHHSLVSEFWGSNNLPTRPGLKAVDLFNAIEDGTIKTVWIIGTNPVVSLPDSERIKQILQQCELVIVSDCMSSTDSVDLAHIKLPATTWGEKSGTVTNSERRISRQRPFMNPPGEARPDWMIITQVAQKMGYRDDFNYQNPAQIFREHAALTTYKNGGQRDLNLGEMKNLSDPAYEHLAPTQWPMGEKRPFSDGQFYTSSGKAQLIPVTPAQSETALSRDYPFILNTGRTRDQWHTMTRSGKSPRLGSHAEAPYVEITREDAQEYDIQENELVTISTSRHHVIVQTRITDGQHGQLFAPFHWSDHNSNQARINTLVAAHTDSISGQPAFKQSAVSIRPYHPKWRGFLLSRRALPISECGYWSRSRSKGVWRHQIAGMEPKEDWAQLARNWCCAEQDQVHWVEYLDSAHNQYRAARIVNGQLDTCLYIGTSESLPDHDWIESAFLKPKLELEERTALLSGKSLQSGADKGATICACFGVGKREIEALIVEKQITTVEEITAHLRAGGNCGSCLPELKKLLLTEREIPK